MWTLAIVCFQALACGIKRIAPLRIERLSAWVALAWVGSLSWANPLTDFTALIPLALMAPEWLWTLLMAGIASSQFIGNLFRIKFLRIAGGIAAVLVWMFLAAQMALITNFKGFTWLTYIVLAWGMSCSVNDVARGDRRA